MDIAVKVMIGIGVIAVATFAGVMIPRGIALLWYALKGWVHRMAVSLAEKTETREMEPR